MSTKSLICFDASIKQNKVGIGIYDHTKKNKVYKSFNKPKNCNSDVAETMALIATLQYINENDIEQAHLFTDNMQVYNKGINKSMLRKYCTNLINVELFWLPREFNREADELSKKGSEVSKTNINELTSSGSWSLKHAIREYPLEKRLNLLKRLATSEHQMDYLMRGIFNPNADYDSDDKKFIKICCWICSNEELPVNAENRKLHKIKLTSKFLSDYIRSKNLI